MRILLLLIGGFISTLSWGQDVIELPADSTERDSISSLIMSSDTLIYTQTDDGREVDTLINNVILIQDSLFMSCNYAIVKDQIEAFAIGDIVIVQNDSIFIYADTLIYNGLLKIAILSGEVILNNNGRLLNTNRLIYNVGQKTASFNNGGKLVDDISTLDSKEGSYNVNSQIARFKHNVRFQDTSKVIISDSLQYNYHSSRIRFDSPTNIYQDSTTIYAESGVYDTDIDKGILSQNVQVSMADRDITSGLLVYEGRQSLYKMYINPTIYEKSGAIARGDSIVYQSDSLLLNLMGHASYIDEDQVIYADVISYDQNDGTYKTNGRSTVQQEETTIEAQSIYKEENGEIVASGSVVLRDTSSKTTILCDRVLRIDSINVSKAYGLNTQPILIYELGNSDSLVLKADTLLSYKIDTIDYFSAFYNVSLLKGEITGLADSMSFNAVDSTFTLFKNPILWSDSTQLSADTISIRLSDGSIDNATLIDNAFIIELDDLDQFNQVNGNRIDCGFIGQALHNAQVNGNSRLIYYIRDENEDLKGVNSTLSSRMDFRFVDNEIENIRFFKKPESEIFENNQSVDLTIFKIDGFKWRLNEKPLLSTFAIFNNQ